MCQYLCAALNLCEANHSYTYDSSSNETQIVCVIVVASRGVTSVSCTIRLSLSFALHSQLIFAIQNNEKKLLLFVLFRMLVPLLASEYARAQAHVCVCAVCGRMARSTINFRKGNKNHGREEEAKSDREKRKKINVNVSTHSRRTYECVRRIRNCV